MYSGVSNAPAPLFFAHIEPTIYYVLMIVPQAPLSPPNFLDLSKSLVLRFENVRESLGKFLFGVIHVL